MQKPLISIIIPTYDRPRLLQIALQSIKAQKAINQLEIIVVDNHPHHTAKQISQFYATQKVEYLTEKNLGHSFAKNKGLSVAKGEYCIFLDDDAKLPINWSSNAMHIIMKIKADIFGGPIIPYFEEPPPPWFKKEYECRNFGNKERYMEPEEFLATSSTLIRTKKLKAIGGFNNKYGIKGTKRRFGEDTDVLRVLRQDDLTETFYSPTLAVEHFTPSEKTTLQYRTKHHFNLGASGLAVSNHSIPRVKILFKAIVALVQIALGHIVAYTARNKAKYPYPQNYLWEQVVPNYYWFGRLIAESK